MTCRLCDNPPSWVGWDDDPAKPTARRIVVCGLHMLVGDEPLTEVPG